MVYTHAYSTTEMCQIRVWLRRLTCHTNLRFNGALMFFPLSSSFDLRTTSHFPNVDFGSRSLVPSRFCVNNCSAEFKRIRKPWFLPDFTNICAHWPTLTSQSQPNESINGGSTQNPEEFFFLLLPILQIWEVAIGGEKKKSWHLPANTSLKNTSCKLRYPTKNILPQNNYKLLLIKIIVCDDGGLMCCEVTV